MAVTLEQARSAKARAKTELADVPGVVGIGVTMVGPDYALKVNLREALPPSVSIPDRIEGVAVQVEIVGGIRKRSSS